MVGVGSFFSAFGSAEFPRYFWCAFVGMPIVFVGLVMCQFAFMGAIFRDQAGGRDKKNSNITPATIRPTHGEAPFVR